MNSVRKFTKYLVQAHIKLKEFTKLFFLYFNKKRFTCWNTLSKFNPDDKLLQNLSGVGFGLGWKHQRYVLIHAFNSLFIQSHNKGM